MKTTLDWLATHLKTNAPLAVIVDRLVMLGHDVEAVENRAHGLEAFTVAAVVAVCVLLSWFAAMTAAGQKRWRESGGVAVQGGTATRPDLTAATVEKNRKRLDEADHAIDIVEMCSRQVRRKIRRR